jgi:hypothetical protein
MVEDAKLSIVVHWCLLQPISACTRKLEKELARVIYVCGNDSDVPYSRKKEKSDLEIPSVRWLFYPDLYTFHFLIHF